MFQLAHFNWINCYLFGKCTTFDGTKLKKIYQVGLSAIDDFSYYNFGWLGLKWHNSQMA